MTNVPDRVVVSGLERARVELVGPCHQGHDLREPVGPGRVKAGGGAEGGERVFGPVLLDEDRSEAGMEQRPLRREFNSAAVRGFRMLEHAVAGEDQADEFPDVFVVRVDRGGVLRGGERFGRPAGLSHEFGPEQLGSANESRSSSS